MKVLLINSVCGIGSTGKIVGALAEEFAAQGHEAVIAYGEMPLRESVEGWTEFTIPIEYRSTSRVPTHLVIVCSSSRYGDYFTGSTQSVMWLDDFELVYE